MNQADGHGEKQSVTSDGADESRHNPKSSGFVPLVYNELRRVAGSYFKGQPENHTLQPTALVHEAFMKLAGQSEIKWNDQTHFFAVAATAMRQILINHAAQRAAAKRGGDRLRLEFDERFENEIEQHINSLPGEDAGTDLLELNTALEELEQLDQRKARVVELRCFGGLTHEQIAYVLDVSKRTVEADWRLARAWLSSALRDMNSSGSDT